MPVRVYPLGRPVDILLVAAARRLRAPLRAQLAEDGYEVKALSSWDEAELLLRTRALKPRAIVLDVEDEPNPAAGLRSFARLAGTARVLVLTASSILPAADIRALGFAHVIARPFRIKDVEEKVREILRGDSG